MHTITHLHTTVKNTRIRKHHYRSVQGTLSNLIDMLQGYSNYIEISQENIDKILN